MGKTYRGEKGPGYEYYGRRDSDDFGKKMAKRRMNHRERAKLREALKHEKYEEIPRRVAI